MKTAEAKDKSQFQARKASEAELLKSGTSVPRAAAARVGYVPVPLEQVIVDALRAIPVFLQTSTSGGDQFTLYSAANGRFTEHHRLRLQMAKVRFIYIPMSMQKKFQEQMEQALEQMVENPELAIGTKSALVYETSIELMNEVLTEQGVGKHLPRLEQVSRAVSTLVLSEPQAFAHLFATAQHDFYTATHMINVGTWMTSLAYAMGVTDTTELEAVCTAGLLHDVGKMFVEPEVLNKSEPLTNAEWDLLRAHPARGEAHLREQGITHETVLRVTLEHHERLDGSGYPHKLPADRVHLMSKVCAVVDSFDAMTACRPFKKRVRSISEALGVLQADAKAGKYDAKIVEVWTGLLQNASKAGVIGPVEIPGEVKPVGRRAHERFAIDCPATMHLLVNKPDGTWQEMPAVPAKGHSISRGGLGIMAERPVELGQYLRAQLKGTGTLTRVLEGQVVRCRAYKDGWYDIGVKLCKAGAQEKASSEVVSAAAGSPAS